MLFDYVARFARLIKTNVQGAKKAVLANMTGLADGLENETESESATRQPLYGQVGFYCRPIPPDVNGYSEYVALSTQDGMVPVAGRDLRLSGKVNPDEGEFGVVQYDGGFISLKYNDDTAGTTTVIYTPKLVGPGGAVEKAHAITLDTTDANLSVSIVHANGMAVLLTQDDKLVLRNVDGTQLITLDQAELVISGVIKLFGGVVAGDATTAQPVALYTTLSAYATAVTNYIGAAHAVLGAFLVTIEPAGGPLTTALAAAFAALVTPAANEVNPALASSQTLKASPV